MSKHKPNFEDFSYRGDASDETIISIAENRQRTYALTGADGDAGEQRLAVYMTTPPEVQGNELIVRLPAWSDDNGRPEGALFDAYVAEATGRRVVAVNAPAIDFSKWADPEYFDASQLSPEQLEELRLRGSFQKTGAAVMRAAENGVIEMGIEDPEFIPTASSMAVALMPGMINAALADGVKLRGITLAEAVNHAPRPLAKLGVQFALQNGTAPGYLAMNPQLLQNSGESMGHWMKRTYEGRRGNWPYAKSLARGTFFADLGNIDGLSRTDQNVPMYISRGGGSNLSPAGPHRELVQHFTRVTGVTDVEFAAPHDHPYTMTVQSIIDGVEDVLGRGA